MLIDALCPRTVYSAELHILKLVLFLMRFHQQLADIDFRRFRLGFGGIG